MRKGAELWLGSKHSCHPRPQTGGRGIEWGGDTCSGTWHTWLWGSSLGRQGPIALGFEDQAPGELVYYRWPSLSFWRNSMLLQYLWDPTQRQSFERVASLSNCARGTEATGGSVWRRKGSWMMLFQSSLSPTGQVPNKILHWLSSGIIAWTCPTQPTQPSGSWPLLTDRQKEALPTAHPVEMPDITQMAHRG